MIHYYITVQITSQLYSQYKSLNDNHSINPINHSINQSINHSINQSINQNGFVTCHTLKIFLECHNKETNPQCISRFVLIVFSVFYLMLLWLIND